MIEEAKRDALQRITDWIMAGGKASDPYVKRQHVYLQEVSGWSQVRSTSCSIGISLRGGGSNASCAI